MVAKIIIVVSLAVAAYAGVVPVIPYDQVAYAEPKATAHYDYSYSVHDGHSGDIKQQQEERAGDAVHGSYSFVQPDGVRRIVHYTADKEHGYNAEVTYEGTPIHQAPVKVAVAAPVAYAQAPVAYAHAPVSYAHAPVSYAHAPVAYAAPVAYSTPVAKVAYAAPLAQVAYASPAISYHH